MQRSNSNDHLVGQMLDGRYRIEALIGAGGMGRVYRGVRDQLGKVVAIKVLTPEVEDSERETLVARFTREAQATAAIRHTNVVEIFDFGQTDDCIYFVMELLDGFPLTDIVGQGKTIDPVRLIWLTAQIAEGLHAAHELGIIHRDVKPANIFICEAADGRERVKLLDFGLAQLNDGLKLTRAGIVFGTPSYMAPEQARGSSLDARTDVYAVGCVMFEALAGRPPFKGENFMMTLGKHLLEPVPRLSALAPELTLPDGLEDIIRCALAKDPAERFSSMDAIARALVSLGVPEPEVPIHTGSRGSTGAFEDPQEQIAALIATLYLSLSHSTDGDLSPVELERVTVELEHWTSNARAVVDHALAKYASSEVIGRAAELTREVTDELRAGLSPDARRDVLAGMWRIAGADGHILETERQFIQETVAYFRESLRTEPVEPSLIVVPATVEETTQVPQLEDVELDAPIPRSLVKTSVVPPAFVASTAVELTFQLPALSEVDLDAPVPRLPDSTAIIPPAFEAESPPRPVAIQPRADERVKQLRAELVARSSDLRALLEGGPRLSSSGAETRWRRAMCELEIGETDVATILRDNKATLELRTCAAMRVLLTQKKGDPTALLAHASDLDSAGVDAITTALELHAWPDVEETLLNGLDAAPSKQRHLWLRSLMRLGIDPGSELIRAGLGSSQPRDLALALGLLCVHTERFEYRYVLAPHFFSDNSEVRQAALVAGLVLDAPGVELLCHRLARDSRYHELLLIHALLASDAQLDELARWSRSPNASEHAGFALGYCGRRAGLAAARSLALDVPAALIGFRFSTGFSDEAETLDEWWSRSQARFDDSQRYMGGQQANPSVMKSHLRHADARLWQVMRLECLVRSRGSVVLPALGLPSRLCDAVDALDVSSFASWLEDLDGADR